VVEPTSLRRGEGLVAEFTRVVGEGVEVSGMWVVVEE